MHRLRFICLASFICGITGIAGTGTIGCTGTGEISGGSPPLPPEPFAELERLQREGPPRYASRVHSCAKMRYRTLGNVLASRGVDLAATAELTAGKLYTQGATSLGAPNYAARVRENIDLGLATTAKIFDLYVQAAPEIIAKLASRPECQVNGAGAQLFDAANHCLADGVSCLIGVPATATHLEVCNETISRAADAESGKRLAVAVLAAAAHTCE